MGILVLAVLLVLWMLFTRTGQQAWSVTKVGVATIPQRLGSSSVVVVGIAGFATAMAAFFTRGFFAGTAAAAALENEKL